MRRILLPLAGLLAAMCLTATADAQSLGPEHRLTTHGADGDPAISVGWHAVAVNPTNGEALVVWIADRDADPDDNGPADLFARRFAPDGTPIGTATMVNDDANDFAVDNYNPPSVAYAPGRNEFLVTWNHEDDIVLAQRLDANAALLGTDITVSNGNTDIEQVKAAYSPDSSSWLVVWKARRGAAVTQQIYGRRYSADGAPLSDLLQFSQFSSNADDGHAIVWAQDLHKFLLVFQGQRVAPNQGLEVHGQFVDANGNQIGPDDFRLSTMGPEDNTNYRAGPPRVAFDPKRDRFLVTWSGRDDRPGFGSSHQEAYAQLVDANGAEIGEDDRRISFITPESDNGIGSRGPDVVYNPNSDQYVAAYHADINPATGGDEHFEIFSQLLDADGALLGSRVQVADFNPGVVDAGAIRPQLEYNPATCDVWSVYSKGESALASELFDTEIFARRLLAPACPKPPEQPQQQQPPAPMPPVVIPPRRLLPPVLGLGRTSSRQRIGRNGYVSIVASCAAPCTVAGTGTVTVPGAAKTYRLRTQTKRLTRAGRTTLRLRLTTSARRAVNRGLRRKRRVTARVTVTATDTVTRLRTRATKRITARR